jgi:hypothetical protein
VKIICFSSVLYSSVTYPAIWRCHHISRGRCAISYGRCGCECRGCASLKEMIYLQWETTTSPQIDAASPAGYAVPPEGDLLASPNFRICDTTHSVRMYTSFVIKVLKLKPCAHICLIVLRIF